MCHNEWDMCQNKILKRRPVALDLPPTSIVFKCLWPIVSTIQQILFRLKFTIKFSLFPQFVRHVCINKILTVVNMQGYQDIAFKWVLFKWGFYFQQFYISMKKKPKVMFYARWRVWAAFDSLTATPDIVKTEFRSSFFFVLLLFGSRPRLFDSVLIVTIKCYPEAGVKLTP